MWTLSSSVAPPHMPKVISPTAMPHLTVPRRSSRGGTRGLACRDSTARKAASSAAAPVSDTSAGGADQPVSPPVVMP